MEERYLTSFEDQESALSYTGGGETLISPQVSLVGDDEVVYSKEIPNEKRIRFAKDEVTGRLYFVVDGVFYDALILKKANIPAITYGEVDLGLPSGLKWADRNVGAETPQDYGAYFSWGSTSGAIIVTDKWLEDDLIRMYLIQEGGVPAETVTQEMIDNIKLQYGENLKTVIEEYLKENILISGVTFDWETTPYYISSIDNDGSIQHLFSKYNETDGLTVLETIDDAAAVNMEGEWRMPTSAETLELVNNTDQYYIGMDGNAVDKSNLDGSELRSVCFVKKNTIFNYEDRSNFIEFPFAGGCSSSLDNKGLSGFVWTSSGGTGVVEFPFFMSFLSFGISFGSDNGYGRFNGFSVRGVRA